MVQIAFVIVLIIWALATANELRCKKHGASTEITGEAQIAFDTLVQFGFSSEEARDKMLKALKSVPDGDCEVLVNIALKT